MSQMPRDFGARFRDAERSAQETQEQHDHGDVVAGWVEYKGNRMGLVGEQWLARLWFVAAHNACRAHYDVAEALCTANANECLRRDPDGEAVRAAVEQW